MVCGKDAELKNNNPDRGLLLISLLLTVLATIIAGLILSADSTDPIKTVMMYVHDGFTAPLAPPIDVLEQDDPTEPEFIIPDIPTQEETTGESPDVPESTESPVTSVTPPETSYPGNDGTTRPEATTRPGSTTSPEVTTRPPETKPPETKPPETKPPETTPPETKPPETTPPETKPPVDNKEYFSDALFIGDSRTVGLYLYSNVPGATYYARNSMNVYNVFAEEKSATKDTSSYTLSQLLAARKFGKIYILLGINEIGYSYSSIVKNYTKTIEYIRQYQPDAKIIIQSNMHVTKKKSDANPNTFSNIRINELNRRLSLLADNKHIFYVDFTHVFDDGNGALNPEYSGDGVHLKAKYYYLWRDWLLEHGKV